MEYITIEEAMRRESQKNEQEKTRAAFESFAKENIIDLDQQENSFDAYEAFMKCARWHEHMQEIFGEYIGHPMFCE